MKNLILLLFIFLLITNFSFSQKENNNWFFGQNCGLTFTPTTVISGSLNTFEGCASISDKNGNLLFYTDGITVYDRSHSQMANGNGLLGNSSSTSSAIIVPKPCSETEYYIFAVDFLNGSNGVTYSLVDMDDNSDCFVSANETGEVVSAVKNISLSGPTGERICALKKANGLDYWVIATEMNTNNFYVYEVIELGVNQKNIQTSGSNLSHGFYMKASPDGTKLGLCDGVSQSVFLYDFNNATAQINNQVLVATTPIRLYGLEFSPNSQKLYYSDLANGNGTGTGIIYGVNISPTIGIPNQIGTIPNQGGRFACGALQLTPENPQRILIAKDGQNSLASIDNPDGSASFNLNAITLNSTCYLGLPTFVSGCVDRCKPLDMVNYRQAVPDLFSNTVKSEIVTDRFIGVDKEYDDIDNDGDVDILFTKSNMLHYLENTAGYCNVPSYPNPSVSLNISNCYSFRLYDWDRDGANDLIVHESNPILGNGIFLYLYDYINGTFQSNPTMLLRNGSVGTNQFPFDPQQLIEVGDLNNDGYPDILISGQGAIYGTAYFENDGFNNFVFVSPQTPGSLFLPDNSGSYHCPELYDADCKNGLDILLSDPLFGSPNVGGARMYFHENTGVPNAPGTIPNINTTGIPNQFGFDDIPQSTNTDLACDWIITRIVDFYNDGCPIAVSYNPCNQEIFFYYQQNCVCSNQNFVASELENNCLVFDRTLNNQASASSTILNNINTQDFTFEAWISGNESDQDGYPIIFSNRIGNTGAIFGLHDAWPATGTFKLLFVQIGQQNYFIVDNGTYNHSLLDGDCHHVAITRAGNTLTFFIDGQIIDTRAIASTVNLDLSSTANLTIGYDFVSPNSFNGSISDIRIWSTARTPAQINNNMIAQLAGNETNLEANWLMNEGTGQILNDNSINGNNAILGNNANIENIDPMWDTDCCLPYNPCPPIIVNNDVPIMDGLYHADQTIESSGTVPPTGNVHFKAGQNIYLKSGFGVEAGANFSANIAPCDCNLPAPNNIIIDNTDANDIYLSWNAVSGAISYYIEYVIDGGSTTYHYTNNTNIVIPFVVGLDHQYTVFTNCGETGSQGPTVGFTNSAECIDCDPAENVDVTFENDSLVISWDGAENASFINFAFYDDMGNLIFFTEEINTPGAPGSTIILPNDFPGGVFPDVFEVGVSVTCDIPQQRSTFEPENNIGCHELRIIIIVSDDEPWKYGDYCGMPAERPYKILCSHTNFSVTMAKFQCMHCNSNGFGWQNESDVIDCKSNCACK